MVEDSTNDSEVGVVYILANPAMPDFVKIGFTKDLNERMRSLDQSSSVPFGFECLHASLVSNPRTWERVLHEVFAASRVNVKREFFESDILPKAALILRAAQKKDVTNEAPTVASTEESPAESMRNRNRRERFNFAALGIPEGEILTFTSLDEAGNEIHCLVSRQIPPRVLYDDQECTLAEATGKVAGASRSMSGLVYWQYTDAEHGSETLSERRRRLESEDSE